MKTLLFALSLFLSLQSFAEIETEKNQSAAPQASSCSVSPQTITDCRTSISTSGCSVTCEAGTAVCQQGEGYCTNCALNMFEQPRKNGCENWAFWNSRCYCN